MNLKGWIRKPSPKSLNRGTGWFYEMDRNYVDIGMNYCVLIRTIDTAWGKVEHTCMKNAASTDIPWIEMQRIKNELFGEERVAVEVFPPESELVDAANMYHMWVMPEGFQLPFTLRREQQK